MRRIGAAGLVFASGFAVMVLEIVGVRYLARDFGSSFYVWTSQIGVILIALAAGYYLGGSLADRYRRVGVVGWLLIPAGVITGLIPTFADGVLSAIVSRHPADQEIPVLWQKLDPALGSALIFLLPCVALAALPPVMIRWRASTLDQVGHASGLVIAASTVGSIAGVFTAGYVLIDIMKLPDIFRAVGCLMVVLGAGCWAMDRRRPAAAAP
jgi:predicted MFS family arabinose efflux permease